MAKRIVVGVDGTPESQVALYWAVEAALLRGASVTLIRARSNEASPRAAVGRDGSASPAVAQGNAQAELDVAVQHARDRLGYDWGSGRLTDLDPVGALLPEAAEADVVVVGARSSSKLSAAVRGSVAISLSAKACCPVVVVRGEQRAGPIVVGVDGSPESEDALAFAFDEAARSAAVLKVVHCWRPQMEHPAAIDRARDSLTKWMDRTVRPYRMNHPAVEVHSMVIDGRTSTRLIDISSEASLMVLGSRGRGRVAGLLLRPVSQNLLHHANAPVAIVRHYTPGASRREQ